MYSPVDSVAASHSWLRCGLSVHRDLRAGDRPPVGSVTAPLMVPRNSCAESSPAAAAPTTTNIVASSQFSYGRARVGGILPHRGHQPDKFLRGHPADFLAALGTQVGLVALAVGRARVDIRAAFRTQSLGLRQRQRSTRSISGIFLRQPVRRTSSTYGTSESGLILPSAVKTRRTIEVTSTGCAPAARASST